MGFLFRPKELPRPASLTFTLDQAGHTYDDGHVGLAPTDITISELRVAVIGLNGAGKSTLLGLLDGSLKANAGTVTIAGGEERLDPAVKKDAKRIDNLVGKVRREEIPNSFYQAANISEAVSEALKKHKVSFEPSAIVADEPSKGLDEIGAAHVAKALFSYNKQVIFATHDTDMIRRPEYAIDRVLVLDEHAVAFDGAPAEAVAVYEDLIRRKYEAAKR